MTKKNETPPTAEVLRRMEEAFDRSLARGPQEAELDAADLDGDRHLTPSSKPPRGLLKAWADRKKKR
jgi:hypothetical protein